MLPPAPATLSMMSGWPSVTRMRSTSTRAIGSAAPPGGNGTMTVIGRDGQLCAVALPVAPRTASIKPIISLFISLPLDVGGLDDRPPLVGLCLLERTQRVRRLL